MHRLVFCFSSIHTVSCYPANSCTRAHNRLEKAFEPKLSFMQLAPPIHDLFRSPEYMDIQQGAGHHYVLLPGTVQR